MENYEIVGKHSPSSSSSQFIRPEEEIRIIQLGDINMSPQTQKKKSPKMRSNEEIRALTNQFQNRRFSSIRAMVSVQGLKREIYAEKQALNDRYLCKQQNTADLILYAGRPYNDYTIGPCDFEDHIRKTYNQISKNMTVIDQNENTKFFLKQATIPDILNVHFPPQFSTPYTQQNSEISEQETKFFNQISNSVEHMKIVVELKAMQKRDYWTKSLDQEILKYAKQCYQTYQQISKEIEENTNTETDISSLSNKQNIIQYLEKCRRIILKDLYYYKSIVDMK